MPFLDPDTSYAVEPGSPYRLVVFRGEAGSAVVGGCGTVPTRLRMPAGAGTLHEARSIAAAEIATRISPVRSIYVEEVLRATLWPWHDNDPEEAACAVAEDRTGSRDDRCCRMTRSGLPWPSSKEP